MKAPAGNGAMLLKVLEAQRHSTDTDRSDGTSKWTEAITQAIGTELDAGLDPNTVVGHCRAGRGLPLLGLAALSGCGAHTVHKVLEAGANANAQSAEGDDLRAMLIAGEQRTDEAQILELLTTAQGGRTPPPWRVMTVDNRTWNARRVSVWRAQGAQLSNTTVQGMARSAPTPQEHWDLLRQSASMSPEHALLEMINNPCRRAAEGDAYEAFAVTAGEQITQWDTVAEGVVCEPRRSQRWSCGDRILLGLGATKPGEKLRQACAERSHNATLALLAMGIENAGNARSSERTTRWMKAYGARHEDWNDRFALAAWAIENGAASDLVRSILDSAGERHPAVAHAIAAQAAENTARDDGAGLRAVLGVDWIAQAIRSAGQGLTQVHRVRWSNEARKGGAEGFMAALRDAIKHEASTHAPAQCERPQVLWAAIEEGCIDAADMLVRSGCRVRLEDISHWVEHTEPQVWKMGPARRTAWLVRHCSEIGRKSVREQGPAAAVAKKWLARELRTQSAAAVTVLGRLVGTEITRTLAKEAYRECVAEIDAPDDVHRFYQAAGAGCAGTVRAVTVPTGMGRDIAMGPSPTQGRLYKRSERLALMPGPVLGGEPKIRTVHSVLRMESAPELAAQGTTPHEIAKALGERGWTREKAMEIRTVEFVNGVSMALATQVAEGLGVLRSAQR